MSACMGSIDAFPLCPHITPAFWKTTQHGSLPEVDLEMEASVTLFETKFHVPSARMEHRSSESLVLRKDGSMWRC
jgi:hypothetical protein